MKITAKYTIALAAAMAFTLAFGLAYAADDELSFMNTKDTGTEIYEASRGHVFIKGSAPGGTRDKGVDRSGEYTNDELPGFSREIPTW